MTNPYDRGLSDADMGAARDAFSAPANPLGEEDYRAPHQRGPGSSAQSEQPPQTTPRRFTYPAPGPHGALGTTG